MRKRRARKVRCVAHRAAEEGHHLAANVVVVDDPPCSGNEERAAARIDELWTGLGERRTLELRGCEGVRRHAETKGHGGDEHGVVLLRTQSWRSRLDGGPTEMGWGSGLRCFEAAFGAGWASARTKMPPNGIFMKPRSSLHTFDICLCAVGVY